MGQYIFHEIKSNPISTKTCSKKVIEEDIIKGDILTQSRPLLRLLDALIFTK